MTEPCEHQSEKDSAQFFFERFERTGDAFDLKIAAFEGHPEAQFRLGMSFMKSENRTTEDLLSAQKWLKRAHESGSEKAELALRFCEQIIESDKITRPAPSNDAYISELSKKHKSPYNRMAAPLRQIDIQDLEADSRENSINDKSWIYIISICIAVSISCFFMLGENFYSDLHGRTGRRMAFFTNIFGAGADRIVMALGAGLLTYFALDWVKGRLTKK